MANSFENVKGFQNRFTLIQKHQRFSAFTFTCVLDGWSNKKKRKLFEDIVLGSGYCVMGTFLCFSDTL